MLPLWASLRFIVRHPLNREHRTRAVARFVFWQIGSRIAPGPVAVPFVGSTRLLVAPGMTGATGNIYCGLHEFDEMGFALHFLRSGDLFADVGANIGAYTVLAAGACGAIVSAAEPDPATFVALRDNVRLNGISDRVTLANAAVGAVCGLARFAVGRDTLGHVVRPGEPHDSETAPVEVTTLDRMFEDRTPTLIKIDVEGFEEEVLRGGSRVLASTDLAAIMMEISRCGEENAAHRGMLDRGFVPCAYDALQRVLTPSRDVIRPHGNILYVRDVESTARRLRAAARFRVHGVDV